MALPGELRVSWAAKTLTVALEPDDSVGTLKRKLAELTAVEEKRQKLLGLGRGPLQDAQLLRDLYKPSAKVMLLGTASGRHESLVAAEAEAAGQLEEPGALDAQPEEVFLALVDRPENQEKLARRIASVKLDIMHPPRPGKKCLVLDIDYTIFDLNSSAERPEELARPFLHEFLTAAYAAWDLVIWSATSMKWIEVKMRELGVSTNEHYKICCFLDCRSMVTVYDEGKVFDCKPLPLLWAKVDAFTKANTLMLDDLRRNYVFNVQNGLVIKPYRRAHTNRATDRELVRLGRYLRAIADRPSLEGLDHAQWKRFLEERGGGRGAG